MGTLETSFYGGDLRVLIKGKKGIRQEMTCAGINPSQRKAQLKSCDQSKQPLSSEGVGMGMVEGKYRV